MASDHTQSREHATTPPLAPTKTRWRPAAGGPPGRGGGTRSWGLISPSRRMFSTTPAGSYPLVLTRFTKSISAHPCPACACGQEDHLRTPGGGLPEVLRVTRRPVQQRSGLAPPKSGDEEDDRQLPSDKGNRPSDRAEWTTVLRDGHLQSAPVVVDVGQCDGISRCVVWCVEKRFGRLQKFPSGSCWSLVRYSLR